ncbi:hypothetical protein [Lysinibacillus xylanilyticus]
MLKKVAIISGIVFSSILLVGCNGEPEDILHIRTPLLVHSSMSALFVIS